jgi:hypothetical protein
MKKNYAYFIAPLAGLAVFTGVYWQYSAGYEARMADMHRKELEAAQSKLNEDAKNREIAAKAAFAPQEKRKADRKAKEAKDAADKDARDLATQNMRKAQNDAGKLNTRVRQLTKDVDVVKKDIGKLEEDKKFLVAEQAFQREYVKLAQANAAGFLATLDKVTEADKKWEDAAKAAAKAAAEKK